MKAKLILLLGVAAFGLGIMTPSAYALSSFTPRNALSNDFPNLNNVAIEYKQLNGGGRTAVILPAPIIPCLLLRLVLSVSTTMRGATIGCGICGLLVKGSNGREFVFSLKNWNGKEQIQGTGFGQSGSSIAGVGIVSRAVPEPASLLLLGAGLVGLGIWRRKSTKI